MAKVHLVVDYIKNLEIGRKISVRSIAQELSISEGTAYKAIKECEEEGYLKTLPRAGTVRVESPKEKKIKNLTYEEVLKIVEGELQGGGAGIEKPIYKFVIGAMELDAMKKYITPGGILIVGNREAAQNMALKHENGVLITGGFQATNKIREMADKLSIPVISSSHDTYTVASLINKALSQNMIRQRILYVSDIMKSTPQALREFETIQNWRDRAAKTGFERFPVLDEKDKLVGMISPREALGQDPEEFISRFMKKPIQVNPKTTVAYAAHLMDWEDVEQIPVTEGDKLLGVISRGDVLKGLKERWMSHKTNESLEDIIMEGFAFEEKDGKSVFQGRVTGEMLDPLGTLSRSLLSMIMVKCSSVIFKNKNLYTEIDNISINYIKPIQPEHRFFVEVDLVYSSRSYSKAELRVKDADGRCIALGLISAVH
ncbi:Cytosolic protein [Clostridiaceae bacterium JG1575]|nr:Cytosolic protein [Clostridiaceae bacterium JG1575]